MYSMENISAYTRNKSASIDLSAQDSQLSDLSALFGLKPRLDQNNHEPEAFERQDPLGDQAVQNIQRQVSDATVRVRTVSE